MWNTFFGNSKFQQVYREIIPSEGEHLYYKNRAFHNWNEEEFKHKYLKILQRNPERKQGIRVLEQRSTPHHAVADRTWTNLGWKESKNLGRWQTGPITEGGRPTNLLTPSSPRHISEYYCVPGPLKPASNSPTALAHYRGRNCDNNPNKDTWMTCVWCWAGLSLKNALPVEPHRTYACITLKQRAAISGPGSVVQLMSRINGSVQIKEACPFFWRAWLEAVHFSGCPPV